MKRFALLVVLAEVGACGGSSAPAAPTPEAVEPGFITREEYGDDWPFTVDSGTLSCWDDPLSDRIEVTFDTGDGIEYALNGSAKDAGPPELDETVLTDYPDAIKTLPLIDRGLDLCDT